jgi:hypothetical protein
MKIFVGGSIKKVEMYPDTCASFVRRLGESIVERGHVLMTGCRGSLDCAIAEAAHSKLVGEGKDAGAQLVSYRLRNSEPAHRYGRVLVSQLTNWDLTRAALQSPEQIAGAQVSVFIAGGQHTRFAANWARLTGTPMLGVAQFGGVGQEIFEWEMSRFKDRYARLVRRDDFALLGQDTDDIDRLADDVVSLAEQMLYPRAVFTIMPFTDEHRDVYDAVDTVCRELGLTATRTDLEETGERIIPRIVEGIRYSAFAVADISASRPNVFYEIGLADGMNKPIIITARESTDLPFDIVDVPVLFWSDQQDLEEKLRRRMPVILKELETRGSRLSG